MASKVSDSNLIQRLSWKTTYLLTRSWLLWILAGIFIVRALFFGLFPGMNRPDALTFMAGTHMLLAHPNQLYIASSAWLAAYHQNPPPGSLLGFISPPTVAYLFIPLANLSGPLAAEIWAIADLIFLLLGLGLLFQLLQPSGSARPLYWLIAFYYPPLLAEIQAAQIGGLLLFLAILSIWLFRRHPILAGIVAGTAGALKFYPAILWLGAPHNRFRLGLAILLSSVFLLLASFLPLFDWLSLYPIKVLLPTLTPGNPDCALVSVPATISRYVGGQPFVSLGISGGLVWTQVPWHFPVIARILTVLVPIGLMASVFWASVVVKTQPVYTFTLALALGALVPGTAFPYQLLVLLPLVLAVSMMALKNNRPRVLLGIALGLLFFLRTPCDFPISNLWTFGALFEFIFCLWQSKWIARLS